MNIPLRFALNHMVAPKTSPGDLFRLARRLGIEAVEIRNDLPGVAILDGTPPETIKVEAATAGVGLTSINALQRFNDWNDARSAEARQLIDYAHRCGAAALVLCPVNDTRFAPPTAERLAGLRTALKGLAPMLADAGLIGLVEPLGFAECSLRLKREAVEAIQEIGAQDRFKLVHDTFHHHVAGETEFFAQWTGLIHASGVVDAGVPRDRMRDPHRVLVTAGDLIGNIEQIRMLRTGGYTGPVSFEPFASSVHETIDIEGALRSSLDLVAQGLRRAAA